MRSIFVFLLMLLAPPGVAAALAGPSSFPTFGVTYTPPGDAIFALNNSPDCVAMYLFRSDSPNSGAVLLVDMLAAKNATAVDIAQALAKKDGGTVDAGTFTIGSEKASRYSGNLKDGPLARRTSFVAVHGKWAYRFSAFDTTTTHAGKSLEAMIATMTFAEPQSPLKHLDELFAEPVSHFDSLTVQVPSCMRREHFDAADHNSIIVDYTGEHSIAILGFDMTHLQVKNPITFDALKAIYAPGLEKRFGLKEGQIQFHAHDTVAGLYVSEPFFAKKIPGVTKTNNHVQFCMLELAPGNFVQFCFSIPDLPADQVKAYQAAADKILASIKITPPRKDQ